MSEADEHDLRMLQRCFDLAREARDRGDHPFGAVLAAPDGAVLIEAMNTCGTTRDRTGHAERNLVTEASNRYGTDFLARCTLYSSAEPCAMCAGAAYWVGVGRVVYGLSEKALRALIGPHGENLTLDLPCRSVFAAGQRRVTILGPLLEAEAAEVHRDFWT